MRKQAMSRRAPRTGCLRGYRPSRLETHATSPVFGRAVRLSRKPASTPEQHLEHELATDIRENEQAGTGDDPAERGLAAPSVPVTPEHERAEHEPAQHREDDLVRE